MSKSTKWVVVALALSLAVNVFVIGFALGKRVIGPRGNPPVAGGPSTGGLNVRSLGKYLSPEQRQEARRLLAQNQDYLRQKGRQLRQSERRIRALLTEQSVDMEELATAVAEHETLMRDLHLTMRTEILMFAATLDYDTRQKIAEDLFRRPPRRGPGGPGPRNRRPPPPGGFQ